MTIVILIGYTYELWCSMHSHSALPAFLCRSLMSACNDDAMAVLLSFLLVAGRRST